jgi:putative ATPase
MGGFPEAAIPLGFTVCQLALAPKARTAADSIHNAITAVKDKPLDVLEYLKLTPVNMKEADKYPYDRPDLWERMQYLPHAAKHETYYEINDSGTYLKQLNENYRRLQRIVRTANLSKLKKE